MSTVKPWKMVSQSGGIQDCEKVFIDRFIHTASERISVKPIVAEVAGNEKTKLSQGIEIGF